MIDAAVLESRAGSTGAYLAFSSVERPAARGGRHLAPLLQGSFLGGGEPSHLLRLRRRWRDLYRDRQETLRRRARTSRGLPRYAQGARREVGPRPAIGGCQGPRAATIAALFAHTSALARR